MIWLLIAIAAYFFLSLSSLVDRYLLVGPLPKPNAYAFFVGLLGGLSLLLAPFGFFIPDISQIILSFLAGAIWILALWLFYLAITKNEVSRVVPAIGGFLPLFTFAVSFAFFPQEMSFDVAYGLAFLFLILGSVLIVLEKEKPIASFKNLGLSALAALAFALAFFLSKLVYLGQPFLSGFIWIRIGSALFALCFLFSRQTRRLVFSQQLISQKRISLPFIIGQLCGSLGAVLQNYSIALAKIDQVALINAAEGVRYVFLLFLVLALGRRYPNLLKEKISPAQLPRKITAVLFISAGLILLVLRQ